MGLGKLLSGAVKLVTLPVDVAEIGMNMLAGGDGSKESRNQTDLPLLSNFRDKVAETLEDLDR